VAQLLLYYDHTVQMEHNRTIQQYNIRINITGASFNTHCNYMYCTFPLTTITSHQLTHNSQKKTPSIPTVQNKHILEQSQPNVTNPQSLISNCSRTLLHKTLHFTNTSSQCQLKHNSLVIKSNSEHGTVKC
jgi:hypothetical protein